MIPLSTMSQYRKNFIENELYRCETQLKTLLESNNDGPISTPTMTITPTEVLQKVTLAVEFEFQTKTPTVYVEISCDGSVFIQNYSYGNRSYTLTNPLKQHVSCIYHVDYNRADGREVFRKYVYFNTDPLIPNDVMHGINATGKKTARNDGNCVISEFPYFINLDFQVWGSMFP